MECGVVLIIAFVTLSEKLISEIIKTFEDIVRNFDTIHSKRGILIKKSRDWDIHIFSC